MATPAPLPAAGGGRSKVGIVVGLVGVAALVLVMVLVVRGLQGQGTGASSPEDLVHKLEAAVNSKDIAAALALLDPDELPTLGDVYESALEGLRATQDIDVNAAKPALDVEVHDLEYDTTTLGTTGRYAKVTFRKGRADWSTHPDKLPAKLKAKATDDDGDLPEGDSGEVTVDDLTATTDEGSELDPFFVLVKTDGRWYVSISMTVGEYAVRMADMPGGDFDTSDAEPSPARTPEEAVRMLVDGGSDAIADGSTDVDRIVSLLPDGETRALRIYGKALRKALDDERPDSGTDGDTGAGGDSDTGVDVTVENLQLSTHESNGNRVVRIDGVDLTVKTKWKSCASWATDPSDPSDPSGPSSSYDDHDYGCESSEEGTDTSALHWDGRCLTTTFTSTDPDYGDEEPSKECLDEDKGDDELGPKDFGITDAHVVVKQERGGWVVDPIATIMDYGKTALDHLDSAKVRRILGNEI